MKSVWRLGLISSVRAWTKLNYPQRKGKNLLRMVKYLMPTPPLWHQKEKEVQIAARPATGGNHLDITGDIDLAHSAACARHCFRRSRRRNAQVFLNLEKVRLHDSPASLPSSKDSRPPATRAPASFSTAQQDRRESWSFLACRRFSRFTIVKPRRFAS